MYNIIFSNYIGRAARADFSAFSKTEFIVISGLPVFRNPYKAFMRQIGILVSLNLYPKKTPFAMPLHFLFFSSSGFYYNSLLLTSPCIAHRNSTEIRMVITLLS